MTIVTAILQQMPALRQPQRKFLAVLFATILALRGRVTGRNLSRYCDYSERTMARQFRAAFDWPDFHQRVPAGATLKLRADSGFYSKAVVQWCEQEGSTFTLTADQTQPLLQAMTALPERCWRPLPEYDLAEVAELRYQPTGWERPYRYVVKREVAERKSGELYWKYHALVTNDDIQPAAAVMVWHLRHADMENAIKEHKSGFGLEK